MENLSSCTLNHILTCNMFVLKNYQMWKWMIKIQTGRPNRVTKKKKKKKIQRKITNNLNSEWFNLLQNASTLNMLKTISKWSAKKSKALAPANNMLIHGHDTVLTTWVCILVCHAFCVPHVLPGNNVSQEQWQ